MKVLGICLGASTVTAVSLEGDVATPCIIDRHIRPHDGNPRRTLLDVLDAISPEGFDRIVVTGRKFRHYVNLTTIAEPEAVEHAYAFVQPPGGSCQAIVSAGGDDGLAGAAGGLDEGVGMFHGFRFGDGCQIDVVAKFPSGDDDAVEALG